MIYKSQGVSWETYYLEIFFFIYFLKFVSKAFLGSSYGLAYDILSSGDEFAEFRGFVHYFKQNWWKYILVSLIFIGLAFIGNFVNDLIWYWTFTHFIDSSVLNYIIYLSIINGISFLFEFFGLFLFFCILPSVTAHGSISLAFKQNFTVFNHHWKKIFLLTAILYFGFILLFFPLELYFSIQVRFGKIPSDLITPINITLNLIKMGVYYLLILPLFTIIQTQMYNYIYLRLP
jgi:hypothetical protein